VGLDAYAFGLISPVIGVNHRKNSGAFFSVLTAGVDVQGDRLELQIIGWGKD